MKKKIALLLTVALATMSLLAGCGNKTGNPAGEGSDAGSVANKPSGETVTVSEMLEHMMEENGGTVYMFENQTSGGHTIEQYKDDTVSKFMLTTLYAYNGDTLVKYKTNVDFWNAYRDSYDEILASAIAESATEETDIALMLQFPESDGDKGAEGLYEPRKDTNGSVNGLYKARFGKDFCHMEDNIGESYMVFKHADGDNTYTIIKDTEWSKDKTVVPDTDLPIPEVE